MATLKQLRENYKKAIEVGQLVVFADSEDALAKLANEHKKIVAVKEKNYYDIDVDKAMRQLAACGCLLQLAYACSDGQECQKEVVVLLSKYGSMVKDSWIASSSFTFASLTALKYHRVALKMAARGKMEKALAFVSKCATVAKEMGTEANKLAERAQQLVDHSVNAISLATQNKTVSQSARDKMKEKMAKADAKRKEMQKMMKKYERDLAQAREEEEAAVKKADDERRKQFIMGLVKAGMNAMNPAAAAAGNALGGQQQQEEQKDNGLDARAVQLTKQRHEIHRKMIENAESLSETVSELAGMGLKHDSLAKALKSLEIAIQTLGKIKVIFDNTRVFWIGVENNCKAIVRDADTGKEMADVDKEEMIEAIAASALNWFVLGKVNYTANLAISQVAKGMDKIQSNLPNEEEAQKMIPNLSKEMEMVCAEEMKALKAEDANAK